MSDPNQKTAKTYRLSKQIVGNADILEKMFGINLDLKQMHYLQQSSQNDPASHNNRLYFGLFFYLLHNWLAIGSIIYLPQEQHNAAQ